MAELAGLDYLRKGPEKADSLVVLLHGYGADAADLIGLADPLAPHLPTTAFVAPDAPEPCRVNPAGRQWFPIPWMDGASQEEAGRSFLRSAEMLDAFLDAVIAQEGLTPAAAMLLGFSQGTMMALHVAPRRAEPVAGIIGFSGRLLAPERLQTEARVKPPVLLVHGDADEVVPFASLAESRKALEAAGFDVESHVSRGVGHGIAPDGLARALRFMKQHLPVGKAG